MTQPDVVDRLKQARVGQTVSFLVSRVEEEDKENKEAEDFPKEKDFSKEIHNSTNVEEHEFIIPLNSTGSAGLGIRLKARVTIRSDKTRQDCGIFIKAVSSISALNLILFF